MRIFIKKDDLKCYSFLSSIVFFFLPNIVFAALCSSVISDGRYSSLLQRKHEEILGYWSEAVLWLPSGF